MSFRIPRLLVHMVALILALGFLAGPAAATQLPRPDTRYPTPAELRREPTLDPRAQIAACPPCADQLPQGARVLASASAPPDAAGMVESVVAYFVRDPSFSSADLGRVGAVAVRSGAGGNQ